MRVNVAQAAQSIGGSPKTPEVRQKDALGIPNHHADNRSLAIDQHPDLPSDLQRQFTQVTRQFLRHNLLCRYLAAIDMLETPDLVRFQPCRIAVYALNKPSSYAKSVTFAFQTLK